MVFFGVVTEIGIEQGNAVLALGNIEVVPLVPQQGFAKQPVTEEYLVGPLAAENGLDAGVADAPR